MATCALLGEAVGKAAFLAVTNGCAPHDVYISHLNRLQTLLLDADCFLPFKRRSISEACARAQITGADDSIRDGIDREHPRFSHKTFRCSPGTPITYSFPAAEVESVHLVFDSDLNRTTLPGSWVEQIRCMRSNQRLDHPHTALPPALCKEFRLVGYLNGREQFTFHVDENRKRAYHIQTNQPFDKLVLTPLQSWGSQQIPVISFDFR